LHAHSARGSPADSPRARSSMSIPAQRSIVRVKLDPSEEAQTGTKASAVTTPPDPDSVFDLRVPGASRDGGVKMHYDTADDAVRSKSPPLEGASDDEANAEDNERMGDAVTARLAADAARQHSDAYEDAESAAAERAASLKLAGLELKEGKSTEERPPVPPLTVVMLVAGTRGDVQPFIALGLKLKEYGHRVRLASHSVYRDFVTGFDLEFYPLGGDPKVLSDFIVVNRGIVPKTIKSGMDNIQQVSLIVHSTYQAATEPDPDGDGQPFTAQAIIANPPTYGHIHVAEKLGVPCHLFFTMPWSPTRAFPSPLARFEQSGDPGPFIGMRNYVSYYAVEDYTYIGLRRIVRDFRKKLGLPKLRAAEGINASHLIDFHKLPFGYCWSSALVPKPADWEEHIDVCGYFSLHEGKIRSYQPPEDLQRFLDSGSPPVYVGFGSLRVDNPKGLTEMILGAAHRSGHRVLLASGWANLGKGMELPETVLVVGEAPHDWLLPRCAAAVHHGGAGTTAASLAAACPTTVIYFFGDQPFWGSACHRAGVGPRPIAVDKLSEDKLTNAFDFMARPEVKIKAEEIAAKLAEEDGVARGVEAFHKHLPIQALRGERVEWNLADPPQRGVVAKTIAKGINAAVRIPTRAGIDATQSCVTKAGTRATTFFSKGVWSTLVVQPRLALSHRSCFGEDALAVLDDTSDEDEAVASVEVAGKARSEVELSAAGVSALGASDASDPAVLQAAAAIVAASAPRDEFAGPSAGTTALSSASGAAKAAATAFDGKKAMERGRDVSTKTARAPSHQLVYRVVSGELVN